MTALEHLISAVMDTPPDGDDYAILVSRCIDEARQEQAELISLLSQFSNLCDGDLENVGGGTRIGFGGRLTADMIKQAKELTAKHSPPVKVPLTQP